MSPREINGTVEDLETGVFVVPRGEDTRWRVARPCGPLSLTRGVRDSCEAVPLLVLSVPRGGDILPVYSLGPTYSTSSFSSFFVVRAGSRRTYPLFVTRLSLRS